ncbi:MAG: hypothetical protein AAF988_06635 [Pseudomonadota bacterium]
MKLSSNQKAGFEGMDEDKWLPHKFRFVNVQSAWRRKDHFKVGKDSYLAKTMTDVIYLNSDGKRLYEEYNAAPKTGVERVIVQFDHIEVEHHQPTKSEEAETLTATNLQLDLANAADEKDSMLAMQEKAKAAISLATMAKAAGWKAVEIDGDAYDKFMAAIACDAAGIEHNIDIENMDLPIPPLFTDRNKPLEELKTEITKAVSIVGKRPGISFGIEPPKYEMQKKEMGDDFADFGDFDGDDETSRDDKEEEKFYGSFNFSGQGSRQRRDARPESDGPS